MLFKSIRIKITVVYMVILAITLSAFSAILYHHVNKSLNENMDTLLRAKAEDIANAVSAYWVTERAGPNRYGASQDELVKGGSVDFATVAQKWVQERSKDPRLLDIIIQIFDVHGEVVASSKNTRGITSVSDENFAVVLQGKSLFDYLVPTFPTKKGVQFRVYVTPVIENYKVEYVIQVASPMSSIQMASNTLKVTLLVLMPLTVLLTGVMGMVLARLSLRPVDSMIRTIDTIKAENMKMRIDVPATRDEVQKLAETFNDMLKRLENAFSSQKQLFENLSHELKTPLTILKGEFGVILKKARTPEEYESLLKSGLEEVDKLIKLVENLLILASFESKEIVRERKPTDLALLAQGVINSIRKLAEEKGLALNLTGDGNVKVRADEQQLKQLFLNLIDNAIKYSNPGGSVSVHIEEDGPWARIIIKDTGVGIAERELRRIFDRFYRATPDAAPSKGFGLGLNIVKTIVDSHGGKIEVASKADIGTTFTILLPILH